MSRWKEHLAFNKRERYGVIVLSVLLLAVSLVRASWETLFPASYPDVDFELLADQIEKTPKNESETYKTHPDPKEGSFEKSPNISDFFDPNAISEEKWSKLGFSQKQSKAIVNYRQSIGGFHSAEEVGSSFVISEDKLKELIPWMKFQEKVVETDELEVKPEFKENVLVELNTADSVELLEIRGVGPFYAGKIVELRNGLGGFSSHEQLMSMYGMDSTKMEKVRSQSTINPELIKVRNINELSMKELSAHPFVSYNLARSIVNFKKQHGEYQSLEDLLQVHLMNDSLLSRIRPFFAVHD